MCILLLGALAAFSVVASEMPAWCAWPLASAALVYSALEARRQMRHAPVTVVIVSGSGVSTVDGVQARDLVVTWRGPLAFIAWRDASDRRQRLSCWPDRLTPAARRELRLAAIPAVATSPAASVAP